jgi:hypothetical protein
MGQPGAPSMIVAMPEAPARLVTGLDAAWESIRRQAPKLAARIPAATIVIRPGARSACAVKPEPRSPVVLQVGGRDDVLSTPDHALAWLLHQAAHAITPPSKNMEGRYHDAAYRDAAVKIGLNVQDGPAGFSETSLTTLALQRYPDVLKRLRVVLRDVQVPEAPRRERAASLATCKCDGFTDSDGRHHDGPRRIRIYQSVLSAGPVTCSVCGQPFEVRG